MNAGKEKFLRNEFFTMTMLGALGRSKTYLDSASKADKECFRKALRERLDDISMEYTTQINEENHLSNIKNLSKDLTAQFTHCLRKGKFRIGIAQKALNLYLKYLWCVGLIATPPHCPFDSIIINHLPNCGDLCWTSIDTIEDYQKLVVAARTKANDKPLAQWELSIWTDSIRAASDAAKPVSLFEGETKEKCFREKSTRFHDGLKQAMASRSGETLRTSQIRRIVESVPNLVDHADWVYPSDHCINHTNKGACRCALSEEAIFEKIGYGKYRVRNTA